VRLTETVVMTRNTQQSEKLPLEHGVTVRTDNTRFNYIQLMWRIG
jgi:hypothetical protein